MEHPGRTSPTRSGPVTRLWEQVTARALDRVGIGAGMRCLDVGCGPGEVMRLMAERVGAGGRVTGLDNDGRVGREAVEVLRATVAGQFEFIQADAAGLRFGLTTEAAGQAFVAEITEAIRQRRGVGMSPLLVSAWKYKPQHNAAAAP